VTFLEPFAAVDVVIERAAGDGAVNVKMSPPEQFGTASSSRLRMTGNP
jgi:hypothetical protein